VEKINDFKQLVAWQLSMELGNLVDDMTSQPPASEDPDFCKQILKASAKAAPQMAEGFLRYRPKESAYYYRIEEEEQRKRRQPKFEARGPQL